MQQKNKKRKLLLMLPLFVAPIIFLGYLIVGLKKPAHQEEKNNQKESVFNAKLPAANLVETGKNKLELYMQAQKEEAKRKEALKYDPYEQQGYDPAPPLEAQQERIEQSRNNAFAGRQDPNEKKVNDRLDKLMKALNQPADTTPLSESFPSHPVSNSPGNTAQLEELLSSLQHQQGEPDAEMKQLESMLEKLLDIQHPERVKERLAEKKEKQQSPTLNISTSAIEEKQTGNGFFGLESTSSVEVGADNLTILAVTTNDQTITDGSTITLRLLQDVYAGGHHIPRGNAISGKCAITDQRVNIQLTDIIYNNQIFPVALNAYDMDGLAGIHIEGATHSQTVKTGADQAIQNMDVLNYDPSLMAQATTAGVQTVKNLLSRKVRAVQVHIKAGHKVLLKLSSH